MNGTTIDARRGNPARGLLALLAFLLPLALSNAPPAHATLTGVCCEGGLQETGLPTQSCTPFSDEFSCEGVFVEDGVCPDSCGFAEGGACCGGIAVDGIGYQVCTEVPSAEFCLGEFMPAGTCPEACGIFEPTVACCLPATDNAAGIESAELPPPSLACVETTPTDCQFNLWGQPQGPQSSCSDLEICTFQTGACCLSNPGCLETDPVTCAANGGSFVGGACGENSCVEPDSNCCTASGGLGCDDQQCQDIVCAADPFCCDVSWDGICAQAALDVCPVCNEQPEACCLATGGCAEETPSACLAGGGEPQGAALCTEATCTPPNDMCEMPTGPLGVPSTVSGTTVDASFDPEGNGSSDCCLANGGLGCDDQECEDIVCAADPFCCNTSWDGICADEASSMCGGLCLGGGIPEFCGTAITAPGVWYTVVGTGTTITASTCNQADFDTKLSVFCDGCEDPICVDGNDDTGGCGGFTTELSWCSVAGAEYEILVHGFGAATGSFDLTLSEDGQPCEPLVECPVPEPLGGCCLDDATCREATPSECDNLGGTYRGDGTTCTESFGVIKTVDLAIPDNDATGVSDTITLLSGTTIADLDVDLTIDHSWVGDLVVELSHGGTTVVLIDRPGSPAVAFGCGSDNYDGILLDDDGTGGPIEDACAADLTSPPSYVPNEALAAFNGVSSAGDWTITVKDLAGSDNGRLVEWSLHFSLEAEICPVIGDLDIKPGSCPNSFNRNSNGVLPVALVGSPDFDVADVDLSTVVISRADGVGGSVGPHEGPPGPHSVYDDVATPFEGELCDCHELEGDGITDLSMKFKTQEVVDALGLEVLDPGALITLVVSGQFLDGTPFEAADCIRLVPPGSGPVTCNVGSNEPGTWVAVSPLDETLDGGGFGKFQRSFQGTTVVTLSPEPEMNGAPFHGWRVNGGPIQQATPSTGATLLLTLDGETKVQAVYKQQGLVCGLGMELALVVPPLLLLRRRLRGRV